MGEVRETVEAFYKAFDSSDFDTVREIFAGDCVTVTPQGPVSVDEHEAMGRAFKAAFPDSRMEIARALESGDEIYLSGRFVGTHTGDLVGAGGTIPASGNALTMPFADYFRVVDGKVVAHEVVWDQLGMLGQLGALPSP